MQGRNQKTFGVFCISGSFSDFVHIYMHFKRLCLPVAVEGRYINT